MFACGQAKTVKSLFLFRTDTGKATLFRGLCLWIKKAILADGRVERYIDMKSECAKQL